LAEILGRIKEIFSFNSSNTHLNSENMDLWNNAVGRKYGKLAKNRRELFELLIKALKNGELIIDLHDKREYKGKKYLTEVPESFVIVIKETATGENLTFFDLFKRRILSKSEFISSIKLGLYPNYIIKKINGEETPVSKKDKNQFNNLG